MWTLERIACCRPDQGTVHRGKRHCTHDPTHQVTSLNGLELLGHGIVTACVRWQSQVLPHEISHKHTVSKYSLEYRGCTFGRIACLGSPGYQSNILSLSYAVLPLYGIRHTAYGIRHVELRSTPELGNSHFYFALSRVVHRADGNGEARIEEDSRLHDFSF